MKKSMIFGLALVGALATANQLHAQSTIASWDFENFNTTVGTTAFNTSTTSAAGTTLNAIAAATGTGSATGLHASASAAWSTPAGNGSANALSVNNWAPNDYYQFQTSTTGFNSIGLTWDQISSTTGPTSFELSYSTDGTNFTNFESYSVTANSSVFWSAGTPISTTSYDVDLSSIDDLTDASTVYFRLSDLSTGVASTGTDRVDNFTINGTADAAPEPSSYALALIAVGALLGLRRFKRTA